MLDPMTDVSMDLATTDFGYGSSPMSDTPTGADRRTADRSPVRAAIVARRRTPSGSAPEAHGETVDISMGGFGALLDGDFGTGDVVDADLVLGTHVISVRALVVGTSTVGDRRRVHCAFSAPPEPVREVLEAFLAQHGR